MPGDTEIADSTTPPVSETIVTRSQDLATKEDFPDIYGRFPAFSSNPSSTLSSAVYNTYAGVDISAMMLLPGDEAPITWGQLHTISYSMHRENTPVRFLGRVNPAGFVKGPRTIAGSLIFTSFSSYAFNRIKKMQDALAKNVFPVADMLPPFDVIITMTNEYGYRSKMAILGVTIIDEGGTMSIDDLQMEETYTYIARGIHPMQEIRTMSKRFMEQPVQNVTTAAPPPAV